MRWLYLIAAILNSSSLRATRISIYKTAEQPKSYDNAKVIHRDGACAIYVFTTCL